MWLKWWKITHRKHRIKHGTASTHCISWMSKEYIYCVFFTEVRRYEIIYDSNIHYFFAHVKLESQIFLLSYFSLHLSFFLSRQSHKLSQYIEFNTVSDKILFDFKDFLIKSKPQMEYFSWHNVSTIVVTIYFSSDQSHKTSQKVESSLVSDKIKFNYKIFLIKSKLWIIFFSEQIFHLCCYNLF